MGVIGGTSVVCSVAPGRAAGTVSKRRRYMNKFIETIVCCFVPLICAAAVQAQPAPNWNRRVDVLAVYPDPDDSAGASRAVVIWSTSAESLSSPVDLSAELVFTQDGAVIGDFTIPASAGPNSIDCLDGADCFIAECANGDYGGNSVNYYCIQEAVIQGVTDCACKHFSPPEWPDFPIAGPGFVSCSLIPADGSAGETRTDDDSLVVNFQGNPIYYDRGIEAVQVTPSRGLPGMVDINISGYAEWSGMVNDLNLDMIVEVVGSDGTVIAQDFVAGYAQPGDDPGACHGAGCGGLCGFWNKIQVDCDPSHIFAVCVCGGGWLTAFPGVDESLIDDMLTVRVRPAPGALPELPDLDGDDEIIIGCPGDLNHDGVIDQTDLGILLAAFGNNDSGDIDGDGDTDQADLGLLLSSFGNSCRR